LSKVTLTRQLNVFDVTNLVVGSIIGADIYVAAALGAKLLGPASMRAHIPSMMLGAGKIAIMIDIMSDADIRSFAMH
jgi:hypothetical protein